MRIHTEYPELTRRYFEKHGVDAEISLSYGATEAKVPEIADAVVEITETGTALRAAGLKVLDTILVSHTELIANPVAYADPDRRKAMEQIQTLLSGALEARGRVLVKLNVEEARPRRRDLVAPGPALTHRVEAGGQRRLRGRDRRRQSRDQHAHPRAQGARRRRHHRAADRQDRPLIDRRRGRVRTFDERRGVGEIEADDGATLPFHATFIADGTRRIAPGTSVEFDVVAGLPGRWEAAEIEAQSA